MSDCPITAEVISDVLGGYGVNFRLIGTREICANRPSELGETTCETVSFCRDSESATLTETEKWRGIVFVDELNPDVVQSFVGRQDLLVVESQYSEAMYYRLLTICFVASYSQPFTLANNAQTSQSEYSNVGQYTSIGEGVQLAPTAAVGPNCSIRRTRIGANSMIQSGVRLGDDALGAVRGPGGIWFDRPHFGGVIIGSNVRVENNTVIQSGFLKPTCISDNCRIGPNSWIGNGVSIGEGTLIGQSVTIAGSVSVGRECRIWGSASIREGTRIGHYAVIGMGSVVVTDVPDYETWFGNPARRRN